jgi:hypothetical protein
MQFTYRVSEADYRLAWKLRAKSGFGNRTIRTIMFWVFILVCLMLVWAVVQKSRQLPPDSPAAVAEPNGNGDSATPRPEEPIPHALLVNIGPFVLIAGIWVFMLFQLGPRRLRRFYLKDPAMQGTYTVDVTQAAFALENTAGVSSRMAWDLYDYWQERKGVIVLVNKSGTYFILNAAGLSEDQQSELRGILSSALTKK